MAQFDPALREETHLFEQIGTSAVDGGPLYRRLKFNIVYYDGSPDGMIEPINDQPLSTPDTITPNANKGRIRKFEIVEFGKYFPEGMHQFE